MVLDLKLKGLSGRRGLMFVSYYGRSRAFISNYRSWREFNSDGRIAEIASSLLSHETLHLTLNKISFSASAQLDELFGQSNYWERYNHGLGDLENWQSHTIPLSKNAGKGARRRSKKK
ncbi:MAG: hypothetical protein WA941_02280 [Nitrososphaeraceae archaeon]